MLEPAVACTSGALGVETPNVHGKLLASTCASKVPLERILFALLRAQYMRLQHAFLVNNCEEYVHMTALSIDFITCPACTHQKHTSHHTPWCTMGHDLWNHS